MRKMAKVGCFYRSQPVILFSEYLEAPQLIKQDAENNVLVSDKEKNRNQSKEDAFLS